MESLIATPCVLPAPQTMSATKESSPEGFEGILAEAVTETTVPDSKASATDQQTAAAALQTAVCSMASVITVQQPQVIPIPVVVDGQTATGPPNIALVPPLGKQPPGVPQALGAPPPWPPGETPVLGTASPPPETQVVEGTAPPPIGKAVETILTQTDTAQTVDARPEMTGGLKAQAGSPPLQSLPGWQPIAHAVPGTVQPAVLAQVAENSIPTPANAYTWQVEATIGPVPPGIGIVTPTIVNTTGSTTWLKPELETPDIATPNVSAAVVMSSSEQADVEAFHAVVQVSLAHGIDLTPVPLGETALNAAKDACDAGTAKELLDSTLPTGEVKPVNAKPAPQIHPVSAVPAGSTESKTILIPNVDGLEPSPSSSTPIPVKTEGTAAVPTALEASVPEAVSRVVSAEAHSVGHLDVDAVQEMGQIDTIAKLRTESVIEGAIHNLGAHSEEGGTFQSGSGSSQGDTLGSGSQQDSGSFEGAETKLQFQSPSGHAQPLNQPVGLSGATSASKSIHHISDNGNAGLRQSLINQMMEKMDVDRLRQSVQQATIDLNPAHLGRMRIVMQMDSERVAASVHADNPVVRQALEAGKEQLRSALESKGFSLGSLDIGFGAPKDQPQAQSNPRSQQFTQTLQRLEQAHESLKQGWQSQVPGGVLTADHLDYQA